MSITSLWISSFLLVVIFVTLVMGRNRHHCDHLEIVKNYQRMCKSYAMWKRSTGNYYQGDFDNDIGQWPSNTAGGSAGSGQNGAGMTQRAPWWWYPQSQKDELQPQPQSQFYGGVESLDPIYFEGEEGLATLERWRRNKEVEEQLENLIRYCCTYGCHFPSAYLEVEKNTNICSLR